MCKFVVCKQQCNNNYPLQTKEKRTQFSTAHSQAKTEQAITVEFQLYVASWISERMATARPPETSPVRQNKTLTHALTLKNRPQYTFLHPKIGLRNHTKHYNPHTFSINHHYIITFTPLSTCNSSRFIFTTTLHSTYNYLLNRLLTAYKYLLNR